MKALKFLTLISILLSSVAITSGAYSTIECSSDAVFSANSCNQCFDGGTKGEGANLGFLKDEWVNNSEVDKLLYKEEQNMPTMKNLNPSLVNWKESPSKTDFWEYTPEFNVLFDESQEGYLLKKGEKVNWLASKKGYAYSLTKNKAPAGNNIGLLVYSISTHNLSAEGEVGVDSNIHNECVLFKSDVTTVKKEETPTSTTPKKTLPKTGPEDYILLLILALVLGFGIMKIRKNA